MAPDDTINPSRHPALANSGPQGGQHSKADVKPNGRQNHLSSMRVFARTLGFLSRTFFALMNFAVIAPRRSCFLGARLPALPGTKLAQPIILACATCASAKISRHSVGAWLYVRHCAKKIKYQRRLFNINYLNGTHGIMRPNLRRKKITARAGPRLVTLKTHRHGTFHGSMRLIYYPKGCELKKNGGGKWWAVSAFKNARTCGDNQRVD